MIARRIILLVVLATSLTGCGDKFVRRNTATIQVDGLFEQPSCPILIDPSVRPEVNEFQKDGRDWFFQMDTKQQIVIRNSGPLKLVPATPDDVQQAAAAERK
jgi:hypothetical protein